MSSLRRARVWPPADEALVLRMASGDQNALRLVFQRHFTRVHRFIFRFVKDTEAAQEIANDKFLIAWRQAASFEGRSLVATWLLGIARYRALAATKVRRSVVECLDDQHEATLTDPSERVDARMQRVEADKRLKVCLTALPAEQRALIEMHYFRDVSLKDAAAITGLPLNTVKTRMFLGRKARADARHGCRCAFAEDPCGGWRPMAALCRRALTRA